jgi:hypothetical protein
VTLVLSLRLRCARCGCFVSMIEIRERVPRSPANLLNIPEYRFKYTVQPCRRCLRSALPTSVAKWIASLDDFLLVSRMSWDEEWE